MKGEENSKENVHFYSDSYDVNPTNFSHFFRGNAAKYNRRIKKKMTICDRNYYFYINRQNERKMLNGLFTWQQRQNKINGNFNLLDLESRAEGVFSKYGRTNTRVSKELKRKSWALKDDKERQPSNCEPLRIT